MNTRSLIVFLLALLTLASITEARVFNPTLGRWMSRDPMRYRDGPNAYQYVRSRPMVGQDPSGLVGPTGCEACEAAKQTLYLDPDVAYMQNRMQSLGCPVPEIVCTWGVGSATNPGNTVPTTCGSGETPLIFMWCGEDPMWLLNNLKHEFMHAYDECLACKSGFGTNSCVFSVCTELRAYREYCEYLHPHDIGLRRQCQQFFAQLSLCSSPSAPCCYMAKTWTPATAPFLAACADSDPYIDPPFWPVPPIVLPPVVVPPGGPVAPPGNPTKPAPMGQKSCASCRS